MSGFPVFASRRVRSTPFSARIEASGLSAYTVYNHMLLPASFASLEEDCAHLKRAVQIWDVAAERQVQLKGRDARKLAVMMSARDLTKAVPGKGYYTPICMANGGMLNDPIALCIADDLFWFSIADSDMLLWAAGLAHAYQLEVEISEPDVSPLAIQGPLANQVMAEVFGEAVTALKFFAFDYFTWRGHKLMIARSGWSKQGGFEIYLHDSTLGLQLWDDIWEAGKEYDMRAGCPNLIERIEGGLLSYGNDMTREDTPLECGLEKFCQLESGHEFIGKQALLNQREAGLKKRIMGVHIHGDKIAPITKIAPCTIQGQTCGFVTSAVYSPDFDLNLGLAMLASEQAENGRQIEVEIDGHKRPAMICELPFKKGK
ncbi:MAG: dimethylsulfoniopropionate demethylase [Candidatus Puniceispirillaceae bacterium]|jgi:dimethylsulfoniopropionate demethylase|nr:dimethylsulfoniopropionate demethylase [Pseudomonadota bacterium]